MAGIVGVVVGLAGRGRGVVAGGAALAGAALGAASAPHGAERGRPRPCSLQRYRPRTGSTTPPPSRPT